MPLSCRLLLQVLLGLLLAPAIAPSARALDSDDLLPVDQAFALSATAPTGDRIELHWKIADGYYLYRHRTAVSADAGFAGGTLEMPDGTPHEDEFFGPVETYRGELAAVFAGQGTAGEALLEVKYQGCADAGICYPPQTRRLRVALPAADAVPAGLPLQSQSGLPGAGALAGLLPGQPPLPETQAFAVDAIADGGNRLLVRLQPAPGYYIYRDRSRFVLEGDAGVQALAPRWPAGTRHHDEHFGEVVVYFHTTEVDLPLQRTHARPAQATLVATFQGCQDGGICYPPMTRRIAVDLPAGQVDAAPAPDSPATAATDAAADTDTTDSATDAPALSAQSATITSPDASDGNALRTAAPPASSPATWAGALLLALLGGLALNLMPCVLPVLSLKALGLVQSGESRQRARTHALWYTAGVLVAFAAIGAVIIGLRMLGNKVGIGAHMQQPGIVATLVYILFGVGLSLSGVFTLGGGRIGGVGQSLAGRSGPTGDFFTGVLACVVGSPCVAPFMGPALAYAFTAPAIAAMSVFLGLGLGLALPFLLIGFVPALARRLPRPGPWMETFKQVLAFPMYLTAVWLLWVLGKQRGVDAVALVLAGMTLLALALWAFERSRWRGPRPVTLLALLLAALALVPVWGVTRMTPPAATAQAEGVVAYSPEALDALRAQDRVVFVNMTADWCVTCKANERNVLARKAFRDILARTGAVYMKGDWTNEDPLIGNFLEEHKAVGVPLYVVYGPGAPPAVLPPVLSTAVVEDALLRAAAR